MLELLRRLRVVPSRWLAVSGLALMLGACARNGPEGDTRPTFEAGEGVPYRVAVEGLPSAEDSPDVASILERSLRLYLLADRLPPSMARLRRRAEADVETTVKVMRSLGFYRASASVTLTRTGESSLGSQRESLHDAGAVSGAERRVDGAQGEVIPEDANVLVVLAVNAGTRFRIGTFRFDAPGLAPGVSLPVADELGVGTGETAVAAAIVSAEKQGLAGLQDQGHAYA